MRRELTSSEKPKKLKISASTLKNGRDGNGGFTFMWFILDLLIMNSRFFHTYFNLELFAIKHDENTMLY